MFKLVEEEHGADGATRSCTDPDQRTGEVIVPIVQTGQHIAGPCSGMNASTRCRYDHRSPSIPCDVGNTGSFGVLRHSILVRTLEKFKNMFNICIKKSYDIIECQ